MADKKSHIKKGIIIVLVLTGVFFGYRKIMFSIQHETTDNAQVETQIVPILPRISGYIKTLNVADFDSVHAGDLLVELDDMELRAQLSELESDSLQAIAELINSKATLNSTRASLDVNRGNIDLAYVKLKQTQKDFERNKNLYRDQAITEKQFSDAQFAVETAQQNKNNAIKEMAAASSKIPVMEAAVKKSEAVLEVKHAKIEETKLKLQYTKIYAPATGKIGKKNITTGQYVQMGAPLFSIVNDSTYWITANFKENQIKNLYPGKQVELRVDAFPEEKITGTIESISDATGAKFALLPPDNSSGNFVKVTQRIPVKIKINELEKHRRILHAGLSVFVTADIN